jgi:hypothetical protein
MGDVRCSGVCITCGVSETPDTPGFPARVEWFLGIGEPRLRSRSWEVFSVAFCTLFGSLSAGLILWYALSGNGRSYEIFLQCGVLFLAVYNLCDSVGTSLYVRRGEARGRALRVFGYAVFFPLSMISYLACFWFLATWFFVVDALVLTVLLVYGVTRAWRGPRDRPQSDSVDGT